MPAYAVRALCCRAADCRSVLELSASLELGLPFLKLGLPFFKLGVSDQVDVEGAS
jgi:hypothetical protein